MRRTVCRGCGSERIEQFLDLGNMPLAGGFLSGREAVGGEKLFPLPVHTCRECGLVQICEVIDPEILFQDYSFSSSTIAPLVKHFEDYGKWLKEKFNPDLVVEFGCNDGILLDPLQKMGMRACGVDVSKNISEMAKNKGFDVTPGYFNEELGESIRSRLGAADIVTGSNAFAHNDEPEKILKGAQRVLKPNGKICLEVMYAGDLLEQNQWDTLYHEHLTFYSLGTLSKLLGRYGFHVVDAERIPMHGGSLRIAASKDASERVSKSVEDLVNYEKVSKLNDPETWMSFGKNVGRKINIVKEALGKLSKSSKIWGYGAAGKATMWVNACGMDYLEAMVDGSPLRAGKLMPGTHTPIVFPDKLKESPPDYIFVTAWNYADLIRSKEEWFKGTWVTPLPDMRFF
jgi:SAM-dependent methyltransferase